MHEAAHQRRRQSGVRLTMHGWAVLGLCLPLYLASLTSQSSLLLTLIGILIGCLVTNYLGSRRALADLEFELPEKTRVEEGSTPTEEWTLHNKSALVVSEVSLRKGSQSWWQAGSVPPGARVRSAFRQAIPQRGIHLLNEFQVTTSHPFGLVRAWRSLNSHSTLVVHPRLPKLDAPFAEGQDWMLGGRQKGAKRTSSGGLFSGIRPHQPGDPLKQIHWKSTAKGLGLMAKVYEEELSGRVTILFDNREKAMTATEFESAIRLGGGLLFASIDAGNQVRWINLGTGESSLFTPFSDPEATLDLLASLIQEGTPGFAEAFMKEVRRFPGKSSMLLIAGTQSLETQEDWEELVRWNEKIQFHFPARFVPPPGHLVTGISHFNPEGVPA